MNNSGLDARVMPRRMGAPYLISLFCFLWAAVVATGVAYKIGFDLYTRSHWRHVEGDVMSYEEKSGHVSIRSRPTYWIEFRVEFDPKDAGCNTGDSWTNPTRFACIGAVKSPGDRSRSNAMRWIQRHPPNSPAKFLYDPATGRLRFAGESIWNIYAWDSISAAILVGAIGVVLFTASRRTDTSKTAHTPQRDELTNLNLS